VTFQWDGHNATRKFGQLRAKQVAGVVKERTDGRQPGVAAADRIATFLFQVGQEVQHDGSGERVKRKLRRFLPAGVVEKTEE